MKKEITITLPDAQATYDPKQPSMPRIPPEKVAAFFSWFTARLSKIPREYAETATIEFVANESYGSIETEIVIQYKRIETDQEEEAREKAERSWAEYRAKLLDHARSEIKSQYGI